MTATETPAPAAFEAGPGAPRRRRRRRALAATAALTVAAVAGVVVFTRLAPARPAAERASTPPARATGTVTRTDLVAHVDVDGTVGFGQPVPLAGRRTGTLTWLPAPEAVIGRGGRLYAADAVAVPLFLGDTPMYRDLAPGVPDGPDVTMLQRNLVALGFAAPTTGHFGSGTTRALRKWQKATKRKVTGVLRLGDVVVAPRVVRVDSVRARLGGSATGDLMLVTGTERLVTAELDLSQRHLARPRTKVVVDLADGTHPAGVVRAAVVTSPSDDDQSKQKLAVTIGLTDPKIARTVETGPAEVRFDGDRRTGVLTVPVEALLALREGGYAVEVVDGTGSRYVAVHLGFFADGRVEVTGAGLAPGTRVVTAS